MPTILSTFFCAFVLLLLNSCSEGLLRSNAPVSLEQVWASDNTLQTPESVLFDAQRNVLYVSNINSSSKNKKDGDGFISKLLPDGTITQLYWVSGLNDPRGMAISNNVLYVADIDEIVAIATQTGSILGRYKADNAQFLNDVAIDNAGTVYVSDSESRRIYQLRNGRVSTFVDNTRGEKPNGLLFDGNRLLVAFMSSGQVHYLDLEQKEFTELVDDIPSADGITPVTESGYLVSNWNGEIYYVNNEGKKWRLLDTKDRKVNAADISYARQTGLLYVPTFHDNRVVAYRVSGDVL